MATSLRTPAFAGKPGKYDSEEFSRAQKLAQDRLYPSIWASNYMVLSNRRRRMRALFSKMKSVGDVLDVGAQYCPYYPLFQDKCRSYTSMDMVATPIVDIVCNAEEMTVADCSYDTVLCTQVLEHCAHPQRIVDECHRVLRPGGTLIVTVPSVFPIHGYPADNWRFMPDGLRQLLRSFKEVEVAGEASFAESLALVNCLYGHVMIGRSGPLKRVLSPIWNLSANLLGRGLSWAMKPLVRSDFVTFTVNLWVEARK